MLAFRTVSASPPSVLVRTIPWPVAEKRVEVEKEYASAYAPMGSLAWVVFELAPNCVRIVALIPRVVRLRSEVGHRGIGVLR